MNTKTRRVTCQIFDAIDQGLLDRDLVIMAALNYMSEDSVADMAQINGFFDHEDDDLDD